MNIYYALQTCDSSFNQIEKRFCSDSKLEVIKKCVLSFLKSVRYAEKYNKEFYHVVKIFDDHSTKETVEFLMSVANEYSRENISVEVCSLEETGIMNSIGSCYSWLIQGDGHLGYLVQDDYLFYETAVFEMIDIFFQLRQDCETDIVVSSYNPPYIWRERGGYYYKNRVSSPRTIVPGHNRYWIQTYDVSCSFLTSIDVLKQNADLINLFLNMDSRHNKLEPMTLNRMFTERGILGLMPIQSIALHMQSEYERDPYIDWKLLWDSINENTTTG